MSRVTVMCVLSVFVTTAFIIALKTKSSPVMQRVVDVKGEQGAEGEIDSKCLSCICQVEGCERNNGCNWDVNSLSCGPYQIKEPYYTDCYKPGADWKTCTTQKSCSETCVRAYMRRYGTYCTEGRTPICEDSEDYAKIHNGGLQGCRYNTGNVQNYWNRVKACYNN